MNKKLRIMRKEIDLENSKIIYEDNFTKESFEKNWKKYGDNCEWWVEDNWLVGKNPENAPGMAIHKDDFFGNVLVEFEAQTILPSTHDIDVMWNGSWDTAKNKRGPAYVAGIEGWWEGKVGIEKCPDYKLTTCTPLFDFQPGKLYFIQAGSINGHCFVFVDSKLVLEVTDPDPLDQSKYGKIGFEAYASFIKVRNMKIRQISWTEINSHYPAEF